MKKEGSCFDLPIAIGILAASEQIDDHSLQHFFMLGEIALDGALRPVQGVLPVSMAVLKTEQKQLILPYLNSREASIVSDIKIWPAKTLRQVAELLHNPDMYQPYINPNGEFLTEQSNYTIDFSDVKGQFGAKRALEVAVAGGHPIAMIGPPGSGKSMLAKRIPTIMPDLSKGEMLEITRIHSVAGTLSHQQGVMTVRPFRNPHHSISDVALVGGGSFPKPGEISLAHLGVLFLDELPEFHRNALESLRQPLEDGYIHISRVKKSLCFPASFLLVCALNPCPCETQLQQTRLSFLN